MKHSILLFLFTMLLIVNARQFPQCSGNYPNPVNVTISPDPPVFGQPVTAYIYTMAYTTVQVGAFIDIQVNNPSWLFPFTYQQDICNVNYVKTCPVSNLFNYTYNYAFLIGYESLTVNIQARLVNPDSTILSCIAGDVTVQAPAGKTV